MTAPQPENKAVGWGQEWRRASEVLVASATAKGCQAIEAGTKGSSLEDLAATAEQIHEVHVHPMIVEVSRENAEVAVMRRKMAATSTSRNMRPDSRAPRSASEKNECTFTATQSKNYDCCGTRRHLLQTQYYVA